MKHWLLILALGIFGIVNAEENGIIGKMMENGMPVIYSFDNYLPEQSIIDNFPTLVVIKWEYDGSKNNGMPSEKEQTKIYKLEDALKELADKDIAFRAYARTGNNLREFVYYTVDQPFYLIALNEKLKNHSRYPLDIVFYQDPEWSDYKKLMKDFN